MVRLNTRRAPKEAAPHPHYHLLIVRPADPDFYPVDWRAKPANYQIVYHAGTQRFRGGVDAFRFTHNHDAIRNREFNNWAIAIPCSCK